MDEPVRVEGRWPGQPGWDSQSFWVGVATTLAFQQADLDSIENYDKGNHEVVLKARLPYLEQPEPEDVERFGRAVTELNEEAGVLFWRHVKTEHGEHYVEIAGTEGYLGWAPPDNNDEGWRC